MKNILSWIIVLSSIFFTSCLNAEGSKNQLNVTEFSKKLNETKDAILVDVRTPEEFAKGHLQNAQNIDWNGNNFENDINKIDKTKPVFVYCLSGGRSASAANKMRDMGFTNVIEMNGGIMKWRAANLPETTSTATLKPGMSQQQFEEILSSNSIILIDFYADWCAPCQKMKPYLEEISNEMKNVKVVRINADDNQELCKNLKVDALPVLQIYKDKKLVWNNNGFISKEEVVKKLNQQ